MFADTPAAVVAPVPVVITEPVPTPTPPPEEQEPVVVDFQGSDDSSQVNTTQSDGNTSY